MNGYKKAQAAYDAQLPPEYWDEEEENDYCPDCKTVNGCSCDEQYEVMREREWGL